MQSLPDRESSITLMRNERTLNVQVQVKTLTDALKSYAKGLGLTFHILRFQIVVATSSRIY
jgi:hypothetical protein